jgi:HJR/Mrr/RecB family endonuclease
MQGYEFRKEYSSTFVNRESELRWLDERLLHRNYSFEPFLITGTTGVGKTALVRHWLSSRRVTSLPLWLDLSSARDADAAFDDFVIHLSDLNEERFPDREHFFVVVDGTDLWNEEQHERAVGKIFNYKMVSALVFTRQQPLDLRRSEGLHLERLSHNAATRLLEILLNQNLADTEILKAVDASKGNPLALSILTELLKVGMQNSVSSLLQQPLYELSNHILIPKKEIITVATPVLVSASNQLIASLQKQPTDMHKLTPREFEKLLADLLADMGWEVELTKQTRDGGADILAYLNTDIGRLLCLVEAKHYREDRKIGVDLVRTLYGTLFDAQANSAMMVTTSTFTKDAKEFQQKHQYQLTLRDYADIVTWILKYGTKLKT